MRAILIGALAIALMAGIREIWYLHLQETYKSVHTPAETSRLPQSKLIEQLPQEQQDVLESLPKRQQGEYTSLLTDKEKVSKTAAALDSDINALLEKKAYFDAQDQKAEEIIKKLEQINRERTTTHD